MVSCVGCVGGRVRVNGSGGVFPWSSMIVIMSRVVIRGRFLWLRCSNV